ncbi:MAG: hypothetical protein QM786_12435 [Breznakibacter sp.]
MHYFKIIIVTFFLIVMPNAYSQCASFLPSGCKTALGNFVHDGNVSSTSLSEGELAELFKTFYADQTYRLVVCKSDNLPPVHLRVLDNAGRVLFDNKDYNYEQVWDFSVKSTQMLIIQMKVLALKKKEDNALKENGCVAVFFGIDKN